MQEETLEKQRRRLPSAIKRGRRPGQELRRRKSMSRVNEEVPEIAEELMPELEDGFFDEDLFDEEEFRNRFSVMSGEELDREAAGEDAFPWDYALEWEEEFEPEDFHPLTGEELDQEAAIEDSFEIGEDEEEEFDPEDFHPLTKEELMTEGGRYFEEE